MHYIPCEPIKASQTQTSRFVQVKLSHEMRKYLSTFFSPLGSMTHFSVRPLDGNGIRRVIDFPFLEGCIRRVGTVSSSLLIFRTPNQPPRVYLQARMTRKIVEPYVGTRRKWESKDEDIKRRKGSLEPCDHEKGPRSFFFVFPFLPFWPLCRVKQGHSKLSSH